MYYPKGLRSTFEARGGSGLRVIGTATGTPKLTATSFERITQRAGPAKAKHVSMKIRKGPWRTMPLFVLTLEEISTCPDSCALKVPPPVAPLLQREKGKVCYGANMPFAVRMDHTSPEFEEGLVEDCGLLSTRYPNGWVLRLHELGDFFGTGYVRFWKTMLDEFRPLHVFGYSHTTGRIGDALDKLTSDRFRIMDSDRVHKSKVRQPAVVSSEPVPGYVTCPQQEGRTPSCITCGLCMNGRTPIRFIPH